MNINCSHDWRLTSEAHSSCYDISYYECDKCGCRLTKGGSIDGDIYKLDFDIKKYRKLKLKEINNGTETGNSNAKRP